MALRYTKETQKCMVNTQNTRHGCITADDKDDDDFKELPIGADFGC